MNLFNIFFRLLLYEIPLGASSYHISPPLNVHHIFDIWTNQVEGKLKQQLLMGASTFYWTKLLSENDVIFDKSLIKFFIQVLYRKNALTPLLILARKE